MDKMNYYFLIVFGVVCLSSLVIVIWFDAGAIIQLLDVVQLIPYLVFMQVNYPVIVTKFFRLFSVYYDFNFLDDLIKDKYIMLSLPGFKKVGIDSLFVRNSQRYIILFAALLLFYVIARLMQRIFHR